MQTTRGRAAARAVLRKAREARGLTQAQVAEIVGISQGFYAGIEAGTRDPSLSVALRIAMVLREDAEVLFAGDIYRDCGRDGSPGDGEGGRGEPA